MPILRLGSKGPSVMFIQEIASASPIDGDFGPITKHCVIGYQEIKNLTRDGIVGKETWKAIVTS